ncbi:MULTISPECIES: DUF262 domain-containing protein [unclassified Psychrobacter]|uniref:DUF262 domain-containing protein n=1 Tax=unclassified Psychrobacter TaxID=196806 RepID=UPI0018688B99|nr:DUF262 domain-containing protein [Psychrobacter sp. FME61]
MSNTHEESEKIDKTTHTEFDDEELGDNDDSAYNTEPFDPKRVDVSITTPNLGALITRLKHDEIDLMPDFQRSGDLWSKQIQSRLIESILIRLPIPAFYFDAAIDDKWQVVDGLQRLSAINSFVVKKNLLLTKLEFLVEYEGKSYDELPRALQRRIEEFQISVYLIKPGTPVLMKYSLFNRINTGGLKLNPQEIRHAMSQSLKAGAASKFLKSLTETEEFKRVVINKNYRMAHEELALRHVSFIISGTDSYKSSMPKFLNQGMIDLGNLSDEKLNTLRKNFLSSLETAYYIFEDDSFKKSLAKPQHRKVVNKPLFESVSVCLAEISIEDRRFLVEIKNDVVKSFISLLGNDDFEISISKSTANTEKVLTRFSMVRDTINKLIN